VRGEGDLVTVHSGRPFDLEANNCLVALTGCFLSAEGADDQAPVPAGQSVELRLSQITTYLSGNLIRLRAAKDARDVRGVVPVQVKPADCLFVAAGGKTAGRALIHLDGPETNDATMKQLLTWDGRHNAYANFHQMLDQQPLAAEEMPLPPYDQEQWKRFTSEADGRFLATRVFTGVAGSEGVPTRALPGQFKVKAEVDAVGYGADVEGLAQPVGEK